MKSEESKDCDVHEDDGIEMFNATGDVESSYEDLLRMLYLFNQMDKYDSNLSKEMKKQKKIKKKMDKNGFLNLKGNKSNTIDIKQVNDNIVLLVLSLTMEELHKSFKEFYSRFDKNTDLYISKEEFLNIIQFLMKMDSITEEKMVMLTKYIIAKSLDTQKKTTKTKIHEIETQDKFTKDLFNRLFHKLMIPIVNASGEREYFIEFLIIKGTSEKEEKEEIDNQIPRDPNSLIYRFELKGYNFNKFKNYKNIAYREIEEIVIRFRNSYPNSITDSQLSLVLNDLQQNLDVNPNSKLAKRQKSLKNLLHWLSYKICINCCLFSLKKENKAEALEPYKFIEENILWSIAAYGFRYSAKLGAKFLVYIKKHQILINIDNYQSILYIFLKKIIPHLTKENMNSMIANYGLKDKIPEIQYQSLDIILKNHIQPMLLMETKLKLKSYIKEIILKVTINMNRSTVSSSPLFRKVHEKLKSPNIKRISNLLTLQKAFTNSNSLQIDNSLIYKDEIEELQESKLKEVKIQRNFALTEDNLKMSNIMQGLKIVKKLMSTQAVETNFPELKSVKTIILNNSLISDHSVSDNESEFDRSQKKLRSDSDNENEERKSSRFLSRKNLSSVNLNLEQTKASVFRRSKQLTVKTIVGIPSNSNLRTHKKHSTLINNDSPIVISPVKRKNLNEFAKPIKKNYKNSIQTRRISKIIEPSTFLGAQFKESEIKEVRPYHKIGLEINNPEMLKNKNFMHKAFTNDLTLNKTTFFSRKLKDKMNRQLLNDNEEESEDMKSRGWIRCGFNSKNSCKCKIF